MAWPKCQTGAGRWILHGNSRREWITFTWCNANGRTWLLVKPTHKPAPQGTEQLTNAAAPEVRPGLLEGTVQPQHVLLRAESLLIQLQSSITEEINVGGNKGQTQRSKTGVGSRRYMLTASRLAPQGFRRAVIYHDIYYFCHVLGWGVHYNIDHFTLLSSVLCNTRHSRKGLQMI